MLPEIIWLRPWFWLALPVFWLFIWKLQHARLHKREIFGQWFDQHLFNFLSKQIISSKWKHTVFLLNLIAVCITVFLAGPAIKIQENFRFVEKRAAVFILDVGIEALATDIQPTRLSHIRYKIEDLMEAGINNEYGLVIAGEDAYTIAPISPDSSTLVAQLPSLTPGIMPVPPVYGEKSRLDLGVDLATELLENAGYANGLIIVLSYSPEAKMLDEINQRKADFEVVIWQFGTASGGPIRVSESSLARDENEQVIIAPAAQPKYIPSELIWLPNDSSGTDIQMLVNRIDALDTQIIEERQSRLQNWIPIDSYFLFPVLIAVLLFIRFPHWLLNNYAMIAILLITGTLTTGSRFVHAADEYQQAHNPVLIPDLPIPLDWRPNFMINADHKSIRYINQGEFQKAFDLAESHVLKGIALIAMGEHAQAVELFGKYNSAMDSYHLGLAHFALNNLQQSLSAFKEAVNKAPEFVEAQANYNAVLELIQANQQENTGNNNSGQQGQGKDQEKNRGKQASGFQDPSEQRPADDNAKGKRRASAESLQRTSELGKNPGESADEGSNDGSENAIFSQDQLVSKGKTDGDVDEEDIELTKLFGSVNSAPVLSAEGVKAVINKLPDEPSFLLKQRLKLMQYQRNQAASEP